MSHLISNIAYHFPFLKPILENNNKVYGCLQHKIYDWENNNAEESPLILIQKQISINTLSGQCQLIVTWTILNDTDN